MHRIAFALGLGLALALALEPLRAETPPIPEHPRDLEYPPLAFTPPRPADHRVVLPNGLVCYLVPDRSVPSLEVKARIRAGEVWVPKEKRGLAKLVGRLLREGGAGENDTRTLDAKLDRIAAEIETEIGRTRGEATLWTLSAHAGEALALFADVLRRPRFSGDRIRRAKGDLCDEIAHRDDDPADLLERRLADALYGDHPAAWIEWEETIERIARDDLVEFHARWVRPEHVVLSVAGDFERAAMEKKLLALFGDWKGEGAPPGRALPPVRARGPGGALTLVDKDVSQGFVEMAHLTVPLDHPDVFALEVLDFVLGGGSFTSRVTARIRNDEGLAYSAGSHFSPERDIPGTIGLYFQSKAESVAFAAKICMEEVARIREQLVAAGELARAKDSLIRSLPARFATARAAAAALAENEFLGRGEDWFETYPARIAAVTAEDVRRAARAHLRPADFAIVIVGPIETIRARDEKNGAVVSDLETGTK